MADTFQLPLGMSCTPAMPQSAVFGSVGVDISLLDITAFIPWQQQFHLWEEYSDHILQCMVACNYTMHVEDTKCYPLTDIARTKVKGQENALDQRGRNPMTVQQLLLFHPYNIDTSTEQRRELFS